MKLRAYKPDGSNLWYIEYSERPFDDRGIVERTIRNDERYFKGATYACKSDAEEVIAQMAGAGEEDSGEWV